MPPEDRPQHDDEHALCREEIASLIRERDEAREQERKLWHEIELYQQRNLELQATIHVLAGQANALVLAHKGRIKTLIRERDEALKAVLCVSCDNPARPGMLTCSSCNLDDADVRAAVLALRAIWEKTDARKKTVEEKP